MDRRNLYMPDRIWNAIKQRADELGISVSELIRRILDEYIESSKQ